MSFSSTTQNQINFQDLPDDILLLLFVYLRQREWISLEQTTRRLAAISEFAWTKLKTLCFRNILSDNVSSDCADSKLPHRKLIDIENLRYLSRKCTGVVEISTGNSCSIKMHLQNLVELSEGFSQLTKLDLRNCLWLPDVSEEGELCQMRSFSLLTSLNLDSDFDISSSAYYEEGAADAVLFKVFSKMPVLKDLCLARNTTLNGSCLFGVSSSLDQLELSFCRHMTGDILSNVFSQLERLTSISLYSNHLLSAACLTYLSTNVSIVDLSFCDVFTAEFVINFLEFHKNLREVRMSHLKCLNNSILNKVVQLPLLQTLVLQNYFRDYYYQDQIHGPDIYEGLKALLNAHELRSIDLNKNDFVDDEILARIGDGCQQLVKLQVSGLANVSETGFRELSRLSCIEELDVSFNDEVRMEELLMIAEHNPRLREVNARNCAKIKIADLTTAAKLWPDIPTVFQIY